MQGLNRKYFIVATACMLTVFVHACFALNPQWFSEFIRQSTIDGYLRTYYFTRDYGKPGLDNESAFSFGGALNIRTAPLFDRISAVASYYAADPLGLNTSDPARLDKTLPGKSINVLGQAYMQYQDSVWLVRAGDQLITTPWLNPADARMIPAAYQALYAYVTPLEDLNITLFRMFKYKSRTSKSFNQSSLYNPANFGGTPIIELVGRATIGALVSGINYKWCDFTTEAWVYEFYDYANLAYADASYSFQNKQGFGVLASMQIADEWGNGKNLLASVGQGKTGAKLYGFLLGAIIPHGQITLGYDRIPTNRGGYRNGDIISPYATGYVFDPLYSSSMIAGLIEKSAGSGVRLAATYFLFDDQLRITPSYARYYTAPYLHNTNEFDIDVAYTFTKTFLKGLILRNRTGILNGNNTLKRFVNNRVMIEYDINQSSNAQCSGVTC